MERALTVGDLVEDNEGDRSRIVAFETTGLEDDARRIRVRTDEGWIYYPNQLTVVCPGDD